MDVQFELVDKQRLMNQDRLAVTPEQAGFACPDLKAFVHQWKDDPHFDCYYIRSAGQAVGFFAIDRGLDRHPYVKSAQSSHDCVLRCFLIDHRHQGKGIATATLCKLNDLLKTKYPHLESCYLTVNFGNPAALKVYKNTGFELFHDPYLGGASGPQHVMRRPIAPAQPLP